MRDYEKEFEKFRIGKDSLPVYENANKFAQSFKRCSIYDSNDIVYSGATTIHPDCNQEV